MGDWLRLVGWSLYLIHSTTFPISHSTKSLSQTTILVHIVASVGPYTLIRLILLDHFLIVCIFANSHHITNVSNVSHISSTSSTDNTEGGISI